MANQCLCRGYLAFCFNFLFFTVEDSCCHHKAQIDIDYQTKKPTCVSVLMQVADTVELRPSAAYKSGLLQKWEECGCIGLPGKPYQSATGKYVQAATLRLL